MRIECDHLASLKSTQIARVGYDRGDYADAKGTLYVEFVKGDAYAYYGVGVGLYNALVSAESAGSYYNTWIRGKYRGSKLDAGTELVKREETKVAETNTTKFIVTAVVEADIEWSGMDVSDALAGFLKNAVDNYGEGKVQVKGIRQA